MIKTKHVINALPLIAAILGRKYGVRVHVGGEHAYTNGKDIHIPSLPLDADETALNLARSYLDHEAAHLRATDFDALLNAGLSSIEKHIWNILEDRMVEQKLAAVYPGCRQNLTWLIKHLFLNENAAYPQEEQGEPVMDIFNWLLIGVRALDVPELKKERDTLAGQIECHFPGLLEELNPIVKRISDECVNTQSCINTARCIVTTLKDYVQNLPAPSQAFPPESLSSAGQEGENEKNNIENIKQLSELLHNQQPLMPVGIGERLGQALQELHQSRGKHLTVARSKPKSGRPMKSQDVAAIRQATTALRTRLQALLQSTVAVKNRIGRTGRIDARRIARVATADPKIFIRKGKRQRVNTAVHILLDASSSMSEQRMTLACKACYAVASALVHIPGVGVAVTSFPGGVLHNGPGQTVSWQTVSPVLKHKEKLHNNFCLPSEGSTPLAEALWWAIQQMHPLSEERKIILILSDGEPDNFDETVDALKMIREQGYEAYGIGIETVAMSRLLPGKLSRTIKDLNELAPAMFTILQDAFIHQNQGGNA